jgi:hypothetical protein
MIIWVHHFKTVGVANFNLLRLPHTRQARLRGQGAVEALKEIVRKVGKLDKNAEGSFVVLKPGLGGSVNG